MFVDRRLANSPRYWLNKPDGADMRVPDEVMRSVVFVGRGKDANATPTWTGTAFIVGVQNPQLGHFTYLVTCKHIAAKRTDEVTFLRVNGKDGQALVVGWDKNTRWYYHPTESESVDVAITPCILSPDVSFALIPTGIFLSDPDIADSNIGPGDEVVYTGLFSKLTGKDRNFPIARMGNVAMMPSEQLPYSKIIDYRGPMDAYLIEARSLGGHSGSPVFVRESVSRGQRLYHFRGDGPCLPRSVDRGLGVSSSPFIHVLADRFPTK